MGRLARWLSLALLPCSWLLSSRGASADAPLSVAAPVSSSGAQRLWATSRITWIYPEPARSEFPVGYLRAGQSVSLRGEPLRRSGGCAGSYVPIEPRGYVCIDRHASLAETRYTRAMSLVAALPEPLPFRYALSLGSPTYARLPTQDEWSSSERWFGDPSRWSPSPKRPGHERLAVAESIAASDAMPPPFQAGGSTTQALESKAYRGVIPPGSMLAYSKSFEHGGRTWLLSADGTVVPAERMRPFRVSSFSGVTLDSGHALPLAWIRRSARNQYVLDAAGNSRANGQSWAARTAVALTGKEVESTSGERFLETREKAHNGETLWIRGQDATVVGSLETVPTALEPEEKWLWVSISKGVLVAYRGKRPVFTTLISPGRGGVPKPGTDPVEASTTPLGVYRIGFKHLADDMGPERAGDAGVFIAQVPYAQYFNVPFALHVAYWHEDFGEPMSGGCINLSPKDGRFLFQFTDPPLPAGWGGVQSGFGNPKGSLIVITR